MTITCHHKSKDPEIDLIYTDANFTQLDIKSTKNITHSGSKYTNLINNFTNLNNKLDNIKELITGIHLHNPHKPEKPSYFLKYGNQIPNRYPYQTYIFNIVYLLHHMVKNMKY